MRRLGLVTLFALFAVALTPSSAPADGPGGGPGVGPGGGRGRPGGILASRHNLSATGPGAARSMQESEVCIFCHVGHSARAAASGGTGTDANYRPYESTTLEAALPSTPSGATRICLSCHDGTIAAGRTLAAGSPGAFATPGGSPLVGGRPIDSHRSHPVSFMPTPGREHHLPEFGGPVRLDRQGLLQCTSCHDPHREDLDPVQGAFLARSNRFSELCLACHSPEFWKTNPAAHQSSTALVDPGLGLPYPTVGENGCAACHRPHDAGEGGQLLKARDARQPDETCLGCHSGRGARVDLTGDLTKQWSHVGDGRGRHDAAEAPHSATSPLPETSPGTPRHVVCVDCHNPHAATHREAVAPRANGHLAGVSGVDRNGHAVAQVQFEYEVCFKCHADSANQPQSRGPTPPESLRRAQPEVNLRRLFDLDAASFHPVEGPGRGRDVPSLLPPLTTSSVIYCSDCHASDTGPGAVPGSKGPRGPHGSIYPHLLERNLTTLDNTLESPSAYALCYKCHSRDVLLSNQSAFPSHQLHVQREGTPCTACHASHGVSSLQGNPLNNAHLIDFDVSIVKPSKGGLIRYTSRGARSGACTLSCHGARHEEQAY